MDVKHHLAIILLLIVVSTQTIAQEHAFRIYDDKEGMNKPFVTSINQDSLGYLWVGTTEGLYTYDGIRFSNQQSNLDSTSSFVTRIFREREGHMWIGHQDGFVTRFENGFRTDFPMDWESPGSVADFTQDERGTLWIAWQNQGLFYLDGDSGFMKVQVSGQYSPVSRIAFIGADQLLIGTYEEILLTTVNRVERVVTVDQKFQDYPVSRVTEIITSPGGDVFILSQDEGIFRLRKNQDSQEYSLEQLDNKGTANVYNLQGGSFDQKENLWVSTMGSGIRIYRPDKDMRYNASEGISTENGLITDLIKAVFCDLEGNLWFGSYGDGLLRYIDNNLVYFKETEADNPLVSYRVAQQGSKLLYTTDKHLMERSTTDSKISRTIPLPVFDHPAQLNTIFIDEDERIWLGYDYVGLYVYDNSTKSFLPVRLSTDRLSNSVNQIFGHLGYLWISTKKGVCRYDPGSKAMKWYLKDDGLPHNNVFQTQLDSKGRLLVATQCNEITFIGEDQRISSVENSRMTSIEEVRSIAAGADGKIWCATQGGGVYLYSDSGSTNFTSVSGLHSDYCYNIAALENGNALVSHRGGISIIDPHTNQIETYSQNEGLKNSTDFHPNSFFQDHSDRLWLGTSEGLIQYKPDTEKLIVYPPILTISLVRINGDTIDQTKKDIKLKPGRYTLSVKYAGIYLKDPESVHYQTKLQGYSNDWSDPVYGRQVTYEGLEYGQYTFSVRAFNGKGAMSEVQDGIRLIIKKPLYFRVWFVALVLLMFLASFFLILRIRERRHRTIQERLLRNIDEKTKEIIVKEEIIRERKRVEKVLIEARNKAEQAEKLKTAFLQNMSHEIRTPMNAIVGFSQLLKEEGLEIEQRNEFVEDISVNAESLLKLIDNILDLSKLETDQLEIQIQPYLVNDIVTQLGSEYHDRLIKLKMEDVSFSMDLPDIEPITLHTDKARLRQILDNLLDNAFKFTEKGMISFGYEIDDKKITFHVKDTGIGLSEEKQKVVFDLFRKIEEDKYKLYGGTGLGLTLSKYLVHLLGGEIDVESEQGIGSRFHFWLPLETPNSNNDGPES